MSISWAHTQIQCCCSQYLILVSDHLSWATIAQRGILPGYKGDWHIVATAICSEPGSEPPIQRPINLAMWLEFIIGIQLKEIA
jgi:hypothetical protein